MVQLSLYISALILKLPVVCPEFLNNDSLFFYFINERDVATILVKELFLLILLSLLELALFRMLRFNLLLEGAFLGGCLFFSVRESLAPGDKLVLHLLQLV